VLTKINNKRKIVIINSNRIKENKEDKRMPTSTAINIKSTAKSIQVNLI